MSNRKKELELLQAQSRIEKMSRLYNRACDTAEQCVSTGLLSEEAYAYLMDIICEDIAYDKSDIVEKLFSAIDKERITLTPLPVSYLYDGIVDEGYPEESRRLLMIVHHPKNKNEIKEIIIPTDELRKRENVIKDL